MVLLSHFRLAGTLLKAARALPPQQAAVTAGHCAVDGSLCQAHALGGCSETPLTSEEIFCLMGHKSK